MRAFSVLHFLKKSFYLQQKCDLTLSLRDLVTIDFPLKCEISPCPQRNALSTCYYKSTHKYF